jgi:hypothetical protein
MLIRWRLWWRRRLRRRLLLLLLLLKRYDQQGQEAAGYADLNPTTFNCCHNYT